MTPSNCKGIWEHSTQVLRSQPARLVDTPSSAAQALQDLLVPTVSTTPPRTLVALGRKPPAAPVTIIIFKQHERIHRQILDVNSDFSNLYKREQ